MGFACRTKRFAVLQSLFAGSAEMTVGLSNIFLEKREIGDWELETGDWGGDCNGLRTRRRKGCGGLPETFAELQGMFLEPFGIEHVFIF